MKLKLVAFLIIALIAINVNAEFVQDPEDLMAADTIDFMLFGHPIESTGDFHVRADIYIFNDANVYMGGTSGFKWDNPNLRLDSVKFSPSFMNEIDGFASLLYPTDSLRLANVNQYFAFNFVDFHLNGILPDPNVKRLQGSYYFTLLDWELGDVVTFDTIQINESLAFQFVSASNPGHAYPLYWPGPKVMDVRCCTNMRGNVNNDAIGEIDIADLTKLIDYLFISRLPITSEFAADVDCNPGVDVGDITALISYLFISLEFPACP